MPQDQPLHYVFSLLSLKVPSLPKPIRKRRADHRVLTLFPPPACSGSPSALLEGKQSSEQLLCRQRSKYFTVALRIRFSITPPSCHILKYYCPFHTTSLQHKPCTGLGGLTHWSRVLPARGDAASTNLLEVQGGSQFQLALLLESKLLLYIGAMKAGRQFFRMCCLYPCP